MFRGAYLWGQMREGNIPDIYVQSSKYWKKYENEIKTMYGHGIGRDERVAIHIRRGDYLKVSQFHVNLWDTGYYHEAVKHFPGAKFVVFCKDNQNEAQDADDKEWCEKNMPFLGIEWEMFNHSSDETRDFNALASCVGLIGANSSFSWWAAFLNPNEDKKIVMPKHWFVDGVQRTELLPEWTLL